MSHQLAAHVRLLALKTANENPPVSQQDGKNKKNPKCWQISGRRKKSHNKILGTKSAFLLVGFLHQAKILKLGKIMNEKMSKRRIQITDLQKQEIEEKEETNKLIRLHIFY